MREINRTNPDWRKTLRHSNILHLLGGGVVPCAARILGDQRLGLPSCHLLTRMTWPVM